MVQLYGCQMSQIKCNKSLILFIVFVFFPFSLEKFDEMIKPFRLHESKNPAQAEARRKEQPFKITDEELSTFEEKVKGSKNLYTYSSLLVWSC